MIVAGVLVGVAHAALHAELADDGEDHVLGVDALGQLPSTRTWRSLGLAMARHCVASTSRTWVVPMPKAMAPTAPWVEVWLSPQAMVMPGWREAQLGPDHVDDALLARRHVEERQA